MTFGIVLLASTINAQEKFPEVAVLTVPSGKIHLFGIYSEKWKTMLRSFYAVKYDLQGKSGKVKVLQLDADVLYDKNRKILLDFRNLENKFVGVTFEASYPEIKTFSPGFYFEPHFGDGATVADGVTFSWDEKTGTFVRAFTNIP